jgi:4-hydroxybenzoate polyprenyltransferase
VKLFATISRLHIVAIAALGALTFGWLFTGERLWALAAVVALDWFLVNLLNRVVDLKEDAANGIAGTAFVARHRRAILWLGFGVLFASLIGVELWLPAILPLRLAYHALGFAYNWPLFPGGRRLKQLYFWKNTASATGFMLTVFGYPLAAYGHARLGWLGIAAAAAFFFLFELSYEVIYDLRDAPGDAQADVRTYPVVHGERGAVRIIDALILTSTAALIAGYASGLVPWRAFIMVVAPLVQLVLYKRALRRGITSADCIGLTWLGAGLLFTYHVWIAAGLPGVA